MAWIVSRFHSGGKCIYCWTQKDLAGLLGPIRHTFATKAKMRIDKLVAYLPTVGIHFSVDRGL